LFIREIIAFFLPNNYIVEFTNHFLEGGGNQAVKTKEENCKIVVAQWWQKIMIPTRDAKGPQFGFHIIFINPSSKKCFVKIF